MGLRIRPSALAALFIVTAILFIIAVAAELFVDEVFRRSSLYGYLIITTLLSGLSATILVEKIDAPISTHWWAG